MTEEQLEIVLEAAILTADRPYASRELRPLFRGKVSAQRIETAMLGLAQRWDQAGKGIELVQVATGWRVQSRPACRSDLDTLYPERTSPLSRTALEILTVIAYRQPITRSEIEDIRGVPVRQQALFAIEARGWVEIVGVRNTQGRPHLYGTTKRFLDDHGMASLTDLPPLPDPQPLEGASGAAMQVGSRGQDHSVDEDAPLQAENERATL